MRSRYWNIGKFADWLRGTPSIKMGTSREWRVWREKAQTEHPFRYWLVEDFIPAVQRKIYAPYDKVMDIKYTILNKYVTKTHALTASPEHIKPGQWRDLSDRILYCLFDELVDFVEIECAWKEAAFNSDEDNKKYRVPKWGVGLLRTRTWRSVEAGMANLKWQSELKFDEDYHKDEPYYMEYTPQAKAAQEIIALYNWWTLVYPARPEPMEESGWSDYCNRIRESRGCIFDTDDNSPEMNKLRDEAHDKLMEIEEQYRQEDEQMLIRLIKIRESLWT